MNREGKAHTQTAIACTSSEEYQWDAFYRAINGEIHKEEMPIEDMVVALRVIRSHGLC